MILRDIERLCTRNYKPSTVLGYTTFLAKLGDVNKELANDCEIVSSTRAQVPSSCRY